MTCVLVQRLTDDAHFPTKATTGSSGYDLYSAEDVAIFAGSTALVKTDIAIELPEGYEAQVRSRSGLASRGITVANSPGTVDADYRGPVGVLIRNSGGIHFHIKKGDRIAQMIIQQVPSITLVEVTELSNTDRGAGGFGSSGV